MLYMPDWRLPMSPTEFALAGERAWEMRQPGGGRGDRLSFLVESFELREERTPDFQMLRSVLANRLTLRPSQKARAAFTSRRAAVLGLRTLRRVRCLASCIGSAGMLLRGSNLPRLAGMTPVGSCSRGSRSTDSPARRADGCGCLGLPCEELRLE